MAVGESRSDLVAWLNATLSLNYTKVEQCGTGAAYCQLMHSVHGDVPMARVKFGAVSEYDARANMKILQAAFNRHGVTRVIDVERLIKCRLQDNLELLQWFRRYWLEHGQGGSRSGSRAARRVSESLAVEPRGGSADARAESRLVESTLRAERNFYFNKLREIELFLDECGDDPVAQRVREIVFREADAGALELEF